MEGTVVESGSVWAGVPAKKVKDIDERLLEGQVNRISTNYQKYACSMMWSVVPAIKKVGAIHENSRGDS